MKKMFAVLMITTIVLSGALPAAQVAPSEAASPDAPTPPTPTSTEAPAELTPEVEKEMPSRPTPQVWDDGICTPYTDRLHVTWLAGDPDSGISEYQYSIGTWAGGTDVINWTSVGTSTELTRTGLSLLRQHQGQERRGHLERRGFERWH